MKRVFLIALIIFTCTGLYLFAGDNGGKQDELKFSHKLHVEENEIECSSCHDAASTSQTGKDNLFPDMETCGGCHDVEDEGNCGMCHSNVDEATEISRIENYSPKFSHQLHLEAKLECLDCHSGIKKRTAPSAALNLPAMSDCISCHSAKSVSVECSTCHLPGEKLKPASHTMNFIHSHSDIAKNHTDEFSANKTCATCHQQSFCQECHEGENIDQTSHPLNYAFTHALDAQSKEKDCSSCHQDRQFCISCHRDYQVFPHNHQQAGWATATGGGLHVMEASNDLESCISCHEQDAEEVCQPCHQQ